MPLSVSNLRFLLTGVVYTFCLCTQGWAAGNESLGVEKLRVVIPSDEHPEMEHLQYYHALIRLALRKTVATDGDFEVVFHPQIYNYERYLREVRAGRVDVMWTNTDADRERELLRIPISIVKDLNSYRIFFIRKEDQPIFDQVKTIDDLRKLKCGLGSQWPDTKFMRANGFNVVTALSYDSLVKMLSVKRFDFFPRGLYEIWREESDNQNPNLVVEKSLMTYYDSPIYFFVRKDNKALAERLERGLRLAIEDGSFDELFFSVPGFKRGYEEQTKSGRLLLKLGSAH